VWRQKRLSQVILVLLATEFAAQAQIMSGDFTGDFDADLLDFSVFQNCVGKELIAGECLGADLDGNEAVDLSDFKFFSCSLAGPTVGVAGAILDPIPSLTDSPCVTLKGTTAGWATIEVLGGAGPVTTTAPDCSFAVEVQLAPNRVNHLFVTGIRGDGTRSAPTPLSVTHDQVAPSLFIDFPPDAAAITTASVDVAGRVSDMLSGFADLDADGRPDLRVTVNGAATWTATYVSGPPGPTCA